MTLEISDDTFFVVRVPTGKTLHTAEDEAIDYLKANASEVDPESDDVAVFRVSIDGEDWTIAELSWQNIALRLMGGE